MIGALFCDPDIKTATYPPVKLSSIDQKTLDKIAKLKDEAPFGRVPGKTTPVTSVQYSVAMSTRAKQEAAIDLRWPFWAALGVGALGVVILAAKR